MTSFYGLGKIDSIWKKWTQFLRFCLYLNKFDSIWKNLTSFEQIWLHLVEFDYNSTNLTSFERIWKNLTFNQFSLVHVKAMLLSTIIFHKIWRPILSENNFPDNFDRLHSINEIYGQHFSSTFSLSTVNILDLYSSPPIINLHSSFFSFFFWQVLNSSPQSTTTFPLHIAPLLNPPHQIAHK